MELPCSIELNTHAFDCVPLERRNTIIESFSNASEQIRKIVNKYWDSLDYVEEQTLYFDEETGELKDITSHYCSSFTERCIVMNRKNQNDEYGVVFRHEYGHYIDDAIGRYSEDKEFREAFQMDKENFDNSKDKGISNVEKMLQDLSENTAAFESRYISDILSAIMMNDTKVRNFYADNQRPFYKHSDAYWLENNENIHNEVFANLFAIYTENNSNVISFSEKWFPSLSCHFRYGIEKEVEYKEKELLKI